MKTVILQRHAYGEGQHRLHPAFWDFAKHSGFVPKVCQPYRPQTKGKVERTICYLRESFYLPWVTQHRAPVLDLALLNQASTVWLDIVANLRWHATLQAQPQHLLQQERGVLQPIPPAYRGALPQRTASAEGAAMINPFAQRCEYLQHALSVYERLLGGAA